MPRDETTSTELPSTLERSDAHAQEIWRETHDSAVQEYGDGERAHRTAYASLKHSYEKVGDHWEPKERRGPSDEQAEHGAGARQVADTVGGVNANASREHLRGVARRLDISGRSTMDKDELVEAIERANDRATTQARGDSAV